MAKIIDEKRYKKITKKQVLKEKEILRRKTIQERRYENLSNNGHENLNSKSFISSSNNVKRKNVKSKDFSFTKRIFKIAIVVSVIFGISSLSKVLVKNNNVVVETGLNNNKKVTLVQNYDLKIGMSKLDTLDYLKTKNIILNELVNISNVSFIKFNKDYSFKYELAQNIEKVSNKEYLVTLNNNYKITVEDIKNSVNMLINAGSTNIYYNALSNIKDIENIDNSVVKITLKEDNPYFVFYLDFPIFLDSYSYYSISNKNGKSLLFSKNKSEMSQINSISFVNFSDSDELIKEFRNGNIDVFTATSDSLVNLIGKYDYNIKKYRNGETIFLLGNKYSKLFSKKEVRQALAYSLNRDEIVKNISPKFSEIIDIPFIYSSVKYKYDIYGAVNILSSNGWQKSSGIYRRNINGEDIVLELNLLVNENDEDKVKIADMIKEMCEQNGLKINIIKKKDNELLEDIKNRQYDILLTNVNINQIPDTTFLNEYLNITDSINSAINILNSSSLEDINRNLLNLQNELSNEIACIGILAKTSNIVYQKNINGFDNIGYMKVFNELEKLGKIQEINYK